MSATDACPSVCLFLIIFSWDFGGYHLLYVLLFILFDVPSSLSGLRHRRHTRQLTLNFQNDWVPILQTFPLGFERDVIEPISHSSFVASTHHNLLNTSTDSSCGSSARTSCEFTSLPFSSEYPEPWECKCRRLEFCRLRFSVSALLLPLDRSDVGQLD
jgi:hypothetical protein